MTHEYEVYTVKHTWATAPGMLADTCTSTIVHKGSGEPALFVLYGQLDEWLAVTRPYGPDTPPWSEQDRRDIEREHTQELIRLIKKAAHA